MLTLNENAQVVMVAAIRSYIMECGKQVYEAPAIGDKLSTRDAKFWTERRDVAFGIYKQLMGVAKMN